MALSSRGEWAFIVVWRYTLSTIEYATGASISDTLRGNTNALAIAVGAKT